MITAGLNSINKLNELETHKQKKYKEKIKRETQLLVSVNKMSAPADSFLVYSIIDLPNLFDNPSFVASLANYDPLDLF
jgi:hypothetical protein